nr:MAG TPA: hypothetical protein [Caudoviricetes sp.]
MLWGQGILGVKASSISLPQLRFSLKKEDFRHIFIRKISFFIKKQQKSLVVTYILHTFALA